MPPLLRGLPRPSERVRSAAVGAGGVVLGAGVWTTAHDGAATAVVVTALALLAAVLAARGCAAIARRPALAPLGVVIAAAGLALLAVTPRGAITVLEALVLGAGIGLASPRLDGLRAGTVAVAAAGALVAGGAIGALWGRTATLRFAVLLVIAMAVVAVADRASSERPKAGWWSVAVVAATVVLTGGLLAWVAGNDPTVEWFGHITTHGDRASPNVAITFDDGPDTTWSMYVARVLDEHGVKGTFFEVGKAIAAHPDVTRALYDDGHLLGNHSYRHDYTGWLDPRYPELGETQAAFERAIGTCPTLFRPPHGQRTPFMLAHVDDRNMHAVTWDVSASDWVSHDGAAVARRILADVKPGSIILLHDGLDGKGEADRSVLVDALPLILDGLQAKGLHPVRLDQLLDVPPYLPHC